MTGGQALYYFIVFFLDKYEETEKGRQKETQKDRQIKKETWIDNLFYIPI